MNIENYLIDVGILILGMLLSLYLGTRDYSNFGSVLNILNKIAVIVSFVCYILVMILLTINFFGRG